MVDRVEYTQQRATSSIPPLQPPAYNSCNDSRLLQTTRKLDNGGDLYLNVSRILKPRTPIISYYKLWLLTSNLQLILNKKQTKTKKLSITTFFRIQQYNDLLNKSFKNSNPWCSVNRSNILLITNIESQMTIEQDVAANAR